MRLKELGMYVPRRLALCCIASCLLRAALADEPVPVRVSITTELALAGDSHIHIENHEGRSIILQVSPGPLSTLQFGPRRVTLAPRAVIEMNLGNLHFPPGRQTLHIISKCFDLENAPAGMGPFLLEYLMVSATEIRRMSESPPAGSPASPTIPVGLFFSTYPQLLRIPAGTSGEYPIEIGPSGASDTHIALIVKGLPQGTIARFTPNPATRESVLTVEVMKGMRPGTYPLTITATGAGVTGNATATLVIP